MAYRFEKLVVWEKAMDFCVRVLPVRAKRIYSVFVYCFEISI
jgi:hypothetical protein